MGGFFGVASKSSCVFDLFFGTDYHSHLGTKRGGMVVHGKNGFQRAIHNIENSPFRTKFERDVDEMEGNLGIGCISDTEPQPLIVRSHLGNFAITTVGRINNTEALVREAFTNGTTHFLEMSGGDINPTELTAALINRRDSIPEGIRYAQSDLHCALRASGRLPVGGGDPHSAVFPYAENRPPEPQVGGPGPLFPQQRARRAAPVCCHGAPWVF